MCSVDVRERGFDGVVGAQLRGVFRRVRMKERKGAYSVDLNGGAESVLEETGYRGEEATCRTCLVAPHHTAHQRWS